MSDQKPQTETYVAESGSDENVSNEPRLGNRSAFGRMNAPTRRKFLQEMMTHLSGPLKNRIVALKNLQMKFQQFNSNIFKKIHKIKVEGQSEYSYLFKQRADIINGIFDSPNEEPDYPIQHYDENNVQPYDAKLFQSFFKLMKQPDDAKGIPNFWVVIFRNTDILSKMMQDHDIPLLKALNDIKINYVGDNSFILEFYFDENEYFTNTVLTKQYWIQFDINESSPFEFSQPDIYKSKGCVIDWKPYKNLCVKNIQKMQNLEGSGDKDSTVTLEDNETFFNFFDPIGIQAENVDGDSKIKDHDFEVGHFFHSHLIPFAVLYFTGDKLDIDDDDFSYDEGDEETDNAEYTDELGDEESAQGDNPNSHADKN